MKLSRNVTCAIFVRTRVGHCRANRTCGKDSCSKRHDRVLHSDDNKLDTQKKQTSSNETNNNADAVLTANSCSGSLQISPITLSSGGTSNDRLAICDTGSTLFFVDKDIRDQLGVQGNGITLNVAGNNGTREIGQRKSEDQSHNSEPLGVTDVPRSSFDVAWEQIL